MIYKKQGWEVRLDALINEYYFTPFVWGENDCFIFAHDILKAVSGVDVIAPYRGQYKDEESARALLEKHAGGKYEASFSGLERVENPAFAQRGDVGIIEIEGKEYCGGIGTNARFFMIRPLGGGLMSLSVKAASKKLRLWRAI